MNIALSMASLSLVIVVLATVLLPSNAAPQQYRKQYHRTRREAAQPSEETRDAAETPEEESEKTPEEAASPEAPSEQPRRGRQLSDDLFNRYEDNRDDAETAEQQRNDKSIAFYDYLRPPFYEMENEVLSRTNPDRGNYPDSPIYYIRLPPTPYMFVPGLGYVSPPPPNPSMNPFINLPIDFVANGKPSNVYHWSTPNNNNYQKPAPKPDLNFISNGKPTSIYTPQADKYGNQNYRPTYRPKPEINLDFVANGKPTNIYRPNYQSQQNPQSVLDFVSNGKPSTSLFRPSYDESLSPGDSTIYRPLYETPRPKPSSNVHNLNKGPYVFNGRPSDIYLLRNSYNALYEDALQNFYP